MVEKYVVYLNDKHEVVTEKEAKMVVITEWEGGMLVRETWGFI